jgi:hypothetical protein
MPCPKVLSRPTTSRFSWPLSPWVRPLFKPAPPLVEAASILRNHPDCEYWQSTLAEMAKMDVDVVVTLHETKSEFWGEVNRLTVQNLGDESGYITTGYAGVARCTEMRRPPDSKPYRRNWILRNRHGLPGQFHVFMIEPDDSDTGALEGMQTLAHELLHVCGLYRDYPDNFDFDEKAVVTDSPSRKDYDALFGYLQDHLHGGLTTKVDPQTLRLVREFNTKPDKAFLKRLQKFHEIAIKRLGLQDRYRPEKPGEKP